MKTLLTIGCLLVAGDGLMAQVNLPSAHAVRSVSGQFVIYDRRTESAVAGARVSNDPQLLELTPQLLVVSCERIKQAIYTELNANRDWQGTIYTSIRPGGTVATAPQINLERLGNRWSYRLELPERVGRAALVRSLVQVVLLEMANRRAIERSAEVPLWLTEGLTQRLLAAREIELILPRPTLQVGTIAITETMQQKRDPDPLAETRRILQENPAATIEELSWPQPETFTPAQTAVFQASAHLLVAELLRLKQGPELLRGFVFSLGRYYNWQTALWQAYPEQFPNQLAFAKWWSLQSAYTVGRDHKQLWTVAESAEQLEKILHTTVAVRVNTNDLPGRAEVTLQTIIAEWDTVRQMALLPDKVHELEQARRRVAPPLIALVYDYQMAVDNYIKQRQRSTTTFADIRNLPPSIQRVAREAIQRLNELDARRASLLAAEQAKATAPATGGLGAK